jgi:uncharacterized protein (TIGR02466 family)
MIKEIFPVKIYKTRFIGNLEFLKKMIIPNLGNIFDRTKDNNQVSMREKGLCSYNEERNLHLSNETTELVNFINHHARIFWKELEYTGKNINIMEMWANLYPPGSFIDLHNHSPVPLTASFYLQKDVDSGNIEFEHPLATLLKHQPINYVNRNTYEKMFYHTVDVEEGDLVIFPGWLNHRTTVNSSMNDRIIIGANIWGT